uniref:Uncharacterized protein n=1 Tax=Bracon brevicornis TaxID=1563983 RepID=A0A6V7LG39_9HYME
MLRSPKLGIKSLTRPWPRSVNRSWVKLVDQSWVTADMTIGKNLGQSGKPQAWHKILAQSMAKIRYQILGESCRPVLGDYWPDHRQMPGPS